MVLFVIALGIGGGTRGSFAHQKRFVCLICYANTEKILTFCDSFPAPLSHLAQQQEHIPLKTFQFLIGAITEPHATREHVDSSYELFF